MTVQAVGRNRWLLRVLLVAGAAMLLSILWFATAARASAQDEVTGDDAAGLAAPAPEAAVADTVPADGVEPSSGDPVVEPVVAPDPEPPTDVPAPFSLVVEVPEPAVEPAEEAPTEVVPAPEPEAAPAAAEEAPAGEPAVETVAPATPVTPTVAAAAVGSSAPSAAPGAPQPPAASQVAARRVHTVEHHPSTPATVAASPAAPAVAVDPCPLVAAPVAATARPSTSWSRGLDGDGWPRHRDDPAPVAVVSPPNVEHARGGTNKGDDPRPSDGPAAGLPTAASTASSGGLARALTDLPVGVEPPQLRVLSTRAGPWQGLVPAPHVEILDLPA